MSTARSASPYQSCTVTRRQGVCASVSRWASFGRRLPLRRGLAGAARRRRREQVGVQPQPGHDADVSAHGSQEIERSEAAVGDRHKAPVGQPAPQLQQHLAAPVEQGLVAQAALLVVALGRRQHCQSAQTRPAQGTGASSIRLSQRKPDALTKWLRDDRTGSR